MHEVYVIDASGLVALEEMVRLLAHDRVAVVLCELNRQPASMLHRAGLEVHASVSLCRSYGEALALAAAFDAPPSAARG